MYMSGVGKNQSKCFLTRKTILLFFPSFCLFSDINNLIFDFFPLPILGQYLMSNFCFSLQKFKKHVHKNMLCFLLLPNPFSIIVLETHLLPYIDFPVPVTSCSPESLPHCFGFFFLEFIGAF